MEENKNKHTAAVGIFVVLGIAFLVAGILVIGNIRETFVKKTRIYSIFEDVNGLQKGNNVWFSGVRIGTVSGISFSGKSDVIVSIKIETDALKYIRKDSKVKVSSDGLIGNKILVIYGGTPTSPEVVLGDTLAVEKTFSSEDMINTLQQNNKNILAISANLIDVTADLKNGKGTVGKLISDDVLYNNLNASAVHLNESIEMTKSVIASLNKFSNNMNKKGTLLNDAVTDTIIFAKFKDITSNLKKISDTTALFINALKIASENPKSTVGVLLLDEKAGNNMSKSLENLESSSKKLDENLEALQSSFLLRRYFKKKDKKKD